MAFVLLVSMNGFGLLIINVKNSNVLFNTIVPFQG
jgi:hypothetical protein